MQYRHLFSSLIMTLLLSAIAVTAQAGLFDQRTRHNDAGCDALIPAIASGYGADGPYTLDRQVLENPGFRRKPVQVFFPQGATGKRPVIFFSHGFGPGRWQTYADLVKHIVSRGYIVVFSSYAEARVSMDERYAELWQGFKAAANQFPERMDLTRVGFVGHSFGGGATPAMAYRGILQQGWGRNGAFLMELAPWYAYQISNAQLQQFPAAVMQLVEVYDQDDVNDHRMAIDIYDKTRMRNRYYFLVHSETVGSCRITADHSTPGRNASLRQKYYAVFRPFDALADAAFNPSTSAYPALANMGKPGADGNYQPLELESKPVPAEPEAYYKNKWSSDKNPRAH